MNSMYHEEDSIVDEEIIQKKKSSNFRWSECDQKKLLYCLKLYGHKNIKKMTEMLPNRSEEEIKHFLIMAQSQARRRTKKNSHALKWLNRSIGELEKRDVVKYWESITVAHVIKYLSVDGLLESHPSPETCEHVDFLAAYRLLYQVLLGYPIQPVNEATANFIFNHIKDINPCKNQVLMENLRSLLNESSGDKDNGKSKMTENEVETVSNTTSVEDLNERPTVERPLNVYQRKDPRCVPTGSVPIMVVVEEKKANSPSDSVEYSIAIRQNDPSNIKISVKSVASKCKVKEKAIKLQESVGFNPFGLPLSHLK